MLEKYRGVPNAGKHRGVPSVRKTKRYIPGLKNIGVYPTLEKHKSCTQCWKNIEVYLYTVTAFERLLSL